MADNQKINLDGNNVNLDWATEETLQLVLRALEKKARGSDPQSRQKSREENQNRAKTSKALEGLSKASGKAKEQIKSSGESAVKAFSEAETSISSFSKHMLGIVGVTGTLGAGFGLAAKVMDEFIDAQTAAAQSGFTFSNEFLESRNQLSRMGMNLTQFATILGEQGSSIRVLGETGGQAARNFSNLVVQVRDATADFGYFGMTGQEMAGIMADKLETLRKAGVGQDQIVSEAAKSFDILNREVLGYARLTGRQRRDIVRNRTMVNQDTYFLSAMNKLGDSALTSAENMTDAFSAYFGEGADEFLELMKGQIAGYIEGFPVLTAEQMGAINAIPGLGPAMQEAAQNFISAANNPEEATRMWSNSVQDLAEILAGEEDRLRRNTKMFADLPIGQLSEQLLRMVVESRNTLTEAQEAVERGTNPFTDAMDGTTASILKLKTDLEEFISSVQASTLSLVGVKNGLAGINDLDFRDMAKKTRNFGEEMGQVTESLANMVSKINSLADSLGVGPTGKALGVGAAIGGLAFGGFKALKWGGRGLLSLGKGGVSLVGNLFKSMVGSKAMVDTAKEVGKHAARQASRGGILKNTLKSLGKAGRFFGKANPYIAFATALLGADPAGDTSLSSFESENPFPKDGTLKQQLEWGERRKAHYARLGQQGRQRRMRGPDDGTRSRTVGNPNIQIYSPTADQWRREEDVMSQVVAPPMSEEQMREQGRMTPGRRPPSQTEQAQVESARTLKDLHGTFLEVDRKMRKMLDALENQ